MGITIKCHNDVVALVEVRSASSRSAKRVPPLSEMKRRSVPAGSKSSWFCSFFAASLGMPSSVVSAVILAILTVARSI